LKLIGEDHSELRYSPNVTLHDKAEIDFTTTPSEEAVLLSLDASPHAQGLLLTPLSDDPMIALPNLERSFNRVTVEMRSTVPGFLEIFWSEGDESFTAEKSQRIKVEDSDEIEEYVFDLAGHLDPARKYRLRVDPIDRPSPVVLRRIELGVASPTKSAGDAPMARKVRLGREVQVAFIVTTGESVARSVTIPPDADLSFALGRRRDGPPDLRFTLSFRDAEDAQTTLFDEHLPASGEELWVDHVLSLRALAGKRGWLEARSWAAGGEAAAPGVAFWGNPTIFGGEAEVVRPNVILVSIDTLGTGHLTAYGAKTSGDDFLTRLSREGTVFESSFASSSLTHVSHGTMLTGRRPLDGNLFWLRAGSLTGFTLADELRRQGYLTAAFTGGVLVTEQLGFDRGFDVFSQADTLYGQPLAQTDIEGVLDRAKHWLTGKSSPWFLFLHSYEVHAPYYARSEPIDEVVLEPEDYLGVVHMKGLQPVERREAGEFLTILDPVQGVRTRTGERILPADVARLRSAHRSEIERVDRALEGFFSELRDRGLLEDTVIVITSDHGEAFFEHSLFEHGLLYDTNLRVPLIFVAPGRIPAGARVTEPVDSSDVAPTILQLAGIPLQGRFAGRSLVEAMHGESLARSPFYAFVPGNGLALDDGTGRKLIWRFALFQENFGRHELFDRVSDPGERRNLLDEDGESAARLGSAMMRLVARLPGIHVDLAKFAGETCGMLVQGTGIDQDGLYALGLVVEERQARAGSNERRWEGLVRFGDEPRLIVLDPRRRGSVQLELRCPDAGESGRFALDFEQIGAARTTARGSVGGRSIELWRVEPLEEEAAGEGFKPEEVEKLRNLGYL
jgi:arylsulfatase A-like enzyme